MSDTSQGPGWWKASDGKWYAPEQHPDARASDESGDPTEPVPSQPTDQVPQQPPPGAAPPPGSPPPGAAPPPGPPPSSATPPPPAYGAAPAAPAAQSGGGGGCLKAFLIVLGILIVLAIVVVAVLFFAFRSAWNDLTGWVDDRAEVEEVIEETGIQTVSSNAEFPPQYDLDGVDECRIVDDGDQVRVESGGLVTNNSPETSNYFVRVDFEVDENSRASSFDTLGNVGADETVTWSATSSALPDDDYSCRIVQVERWAAHLSPPIDIPGEVPDN